MKVYVIMGNDFPDAVFQTEAAAKDYCNQKKEKTPKFGPSNTPRIYWRYYTFDLRGSKGSPMFEALETAHLFGGIDGAHHKMWVIDQMVRALTGPGYQNWVVKQKAGEDGQNTYDWDEGIAP